MNPLPPTLHHLLLNPNRRTFLKQLSLSAAFFTIPGAFAEELTRTPSQTEGPFYPNKLPLDTDNDLLRVNETITPAIGGFIRIPYAARGTRRTAAYFVPHAATSGGPTGNAAGDVYFDDGSNNRPGLHEYTTAWHKLVNVSDFVSYEDDAVFYDDELVVPLWPRSKRRPRHS